MPITTIDGLIAGFQPLRMFAKGNAGTMVAGRPFSYWSLAGIPGPGAFDTTLNGVVLSSTSAMVAGQLPFTNPVSGNSYLARFVATNSTSGVLQMNDRLWHNGGINATITTAQAITSPTFPARDANGATNGDGVLLGVEVSAATGAGTPTITVSYTNQAGVSGRVGTNIVTTNASSAVGTFYPIGLQAGDTGVRSVQSITLSATWTSGTINLVAYRTISAIEMNGALTPNAIDAVTGGLPRMFDGSVPFLVLIPQATVSTICFGSYCIAQG